MRVKGRKWNIFVPTAGMRDHGAFCVIVVTPFVEFDLEPRHLGCYEKWSMCMGMGRLCAGKRTVCNIGALPLPCAPRFC
jgi:hypothetical protein